MITPEFSEVPGVSLSECAERARREFYRLLPHFVRLPDWENITTDLTSAGYADRAARMWAVITRTGQSFPSTTAKESVKAALVGLELMRDAVRLARDAAMQTAPRVELIDGIIMSALNDEEDRELYGHGAAEYLVRLAAQRRAFPSHVTEPMITTTTTTFLHPVAPPWENEVDLYVWQEFHSDDVGQVLQRLAAPWVKLTPKEVKALQAELKGRKLEFLARAVRLAAIHAIRAGETPSSDHGELAEAAAWVLNVGRALELPDAFGDWGGQALTSTWRPGLDDRFLSRLGAQAPIYLGSGAEAIRMVADWCQKQGVGTWEEPEGWAPGGEWVFPE